MATVFKRQIPVAITIRMIETVVTLAVVTCSVNNFEITNHRINADFMLTIGIYNLNFTQTRKKRRKSSARNNNRRPTQAFIMIDVDLLAQCIAVVALQINERILFDILFQDILIMIVVHLFEVEITMTIAFIFQSQMLDFTFARIAFFRKQCFAPPKKTSINDKHIDQHTFPGFLILECRAWRSQKIIVTS